MSVFWSKWIVKYKNVIFIALLVILTLRVIIPQLDGLRESISALNGANLYWILLGIAIFFLGVPVLALQIMSLALKPLMFSLTLRVQMAGLFVSKLLPSFLGSLSLNLYYLIKQNHTPNQAAAVMTMNSLSSGIAYSFLIIIALITSPLSLNGLQGSIDFSGNLFLFFIILLIGLGYLLHHSLKIQNRIKKAWRDLKINFAAYKTRRLSVLAGILCNAAGSLTSIFAIYASAQAIDVPLSFSGALLAYTFGNVAAAIIPTPGGIGAVEAGIYSGLVLVGMDAPDATVVTLLYRLITYWLPILPGYYYFWSLRKKLLANYNFKKSYSS